MASKETLDTPDANAAKKRKIESDEETEVKKPREASSNADDECKTIKNSDCIRESTNRTNEYENIMCLEANVYLFPSDIRKLEPLTQQFSGYFKFCNYAVKNVDFSGTITSVHAKPDYEIYQICHKECEVTAIKWIPYPEKIEAYTNAKDAFEDTEFSDLLPKNLSKMYALGDLVRIQGEVKMYKGEMQVRIETSRIIDLRQLLYADKETARMRGMVYSKPAEYFHVIPKKEEYDADELLEILLNKFRGQVLPGIGVIIKCMQNLPDGKSLSEPDLEVNIEGCFNTLIMNGKIVRYSKSINRYRILQRDNLLYDTVLAMIINYSGNGAGISDSELYQRVVRIPNSRYECLEANAFNKYITRLLTRGDFYEVLNRCYRFMYKLPSI